MSSTLIKLIDASILPASILVVGKVLGLILTIKYFNLDWQVNFVNDSFFSVYPVVYQKDLFLISTYSDLTMLVFMFGGLIITTLRAIYLHNTHIDPKVVVRLAGMNMLGLIKDSFKIYSGATSWFIFTTLSLGLVLVNVFNSKTNPSILIVGFVLLAIMVGLMLRDVEQEISRNKKELVF